MRLKHAASIFYAHFSLRKGEKLFSHFSLLKANVAVATRRKPKVCKHYFGYFILLSFLIPNRHTSLILFYISYT